MTLEDKPLRSEGIQHATEEERRTSTSSSRANERVGPKPKGRSAVDARGSERKVWCYKEKYCIGTWNVRCINLGKLDVFKQEMARINIDILGVSELKWMEMCEFNSDDYHVYCCGQECHRRNGVDLIVNKRVGKAVLGYNLKWQWPADWKRAVYIPIPKKGSAKECSNYPTIALTSHDSKIMLKILQGRLQ